MFLDGLIKIVVVALLSAHYARAGNLTNEEMVGKVAKRGLSSSLHMTITKVLYVAAVIIPSKEDPTRTVCSGIFLHEFWVATAASCFNGRKVRDRKAVIIFGVDDYTAETFNQVGSMQVWLHPEFLAPSKAHDIALIELRRSNKVQMDESKIFKGSYYDYTPGYYWYRYPHHEDDNICIALGFVSKIHNDTFMHFNLYNISYNWEGCGCKKNNHSFLCGRLNSLKEPCFTYKGGPLLCQGLVFGIGSAAHQCDTIDTLCSRRTYFSFTYLCSYLEWISRYVPRFPSRCFSLMSSAPAKSPLIIHHLSVIIFVIIVCN